MTERVVNIGTLVKKSPDLGQGLQRVELETKGRKHFQDALDLLSGHETVSTDDHLAVAGYMASVRITPEPLLPSFDALISHPSSIPPYRARVLTLMGDYDTARQEAEHSNPYIFTTIAEAQIQRGIDPSVTIASEEAFVRRAEERGHANPLSIMELGRALYIAGRKEDGRGAFLKAEELIDKSATKYQAAIDQLVQGGMNEEVARGEAYSRVEDFDFDGDYDRLAISYINQGLFEDALRIVGKHTKDSPYPYYEVEQIVREQLKRGMYQDAVSTARRIRDPFLLTQLVGDVEHGPQAIAVDEAQEKAIEERTNAWYNQDDYITARITLGTHAAQAGDPETAKEHFAASYRAIALDTHPEKAWSILQLAEAVDGAGFDATNLFHEIFREVTENEDEKWFHEDQLRWTTLADAVESALKRDYLTVGEEGLSNFTSDSHFNPLRARMLAALGAAEIRLSQPTL